MIRSVAALVRAAAVALCLAAPLSTAATAPDPEKQRIFLEALELIETGDHRAATRLLRGMLSEDPSLHRVRLELARAHFLAREWERARREFFTVLSADIPDQVRANIIAFLREIDARRGWDWGLNLAFLPGGGLTRSYRGDTVTLDVGGQELEFDIVREDEPDFGVEFGGHVELRTELAEGGENAPKITAGLRAAMFVKEFEGQAFDDYRLRLDAPFTFGFPVRTVTAGPFGTYRWFGGDPWEREVGLSAQLTDRSVERWTLVLGGTLGHVDNFEHSRLDGIRYGAHAGAFRSLGGVTIAGATLGFLRFDADARFESFTEYRAALALSSDLGAGLTGTLSPRLALRDYDAAAPLFPEARKDWEAGFSVQVTKADFTLLGLSPFAGYEYVWHDSNIELHRYSDHIIRTGFTKAF